MSCITSVMAALIESTLSNRAAQSKELHPTSAVPPPGADLLKAGIASLKTKKQDICHWKGINYFL